MGALIRNGALGADDWTTLADDAPLPERGRVIVSLKRWQALREAGSAFTAIVGVRLPNTADLAQAWPLVADRPLLALEFPSFGDGRAYSQARLLRERHAFRGELRATGDVVRDHLFNMHRCGFDAFALRDDQDPAVALAALRDFTVPYQPVGDARDTVLARRRGAAPP